MNFNIPNLKNSAFSFFHSFVKKFIIIVRKLSRYILCEFKIRKNYKEKFQNKAFLKISHSFKVRTWFYPFKNHALSKVILNLDDKTVCQFIWKSFNISVSLNNELTLISFWIWETWERLPAIKKKVKISNMNETRNERTNIEIFHRSQHQVWKELMLYNVYTKVC